MDNNFNTTENNETVETVEAEEVVETTETLEVEATEAPEVIETAEAVETTDEEAPAAPAKANNTLGLISMICGIASIVLSCCCGWIAPIVGAAAIILAIVERGKTKKFSGFAIAGLICGIVGIVIFVVSCIINLLISLGFMAPAIGVGAFQDLLSDYSYGYDYYY